MNHIKFVSAEELETLEDYGASLVSGMVTLKTLESFHIAAFNKGLLEEDEAETGKTLCWEIRRLLQLYRTQMENILDRTEINEEMVINNLRSMMPEVKIPRKKRKKKAEKQDGEATPNTNNV